MQNEPVKGRVLWGPSFFMKPVSRWLKWADEPVTKVSQIFSGGFIHRGSSGRRSQDIVLKNYVNSMDCGTSRKALIITILRRRSRIFCLILCQYHCILDEWKGKGCPAQGMPDSKKCSMYLERCRTGEQGKDPGGSMGEEGTGKHSVGSRMLSEGWIAFYEYMTDQRCMALWR